MASHQKLWETDRRREHYALKYGTMKVKGEEISSRTGCFIYKLHKSQEWEIALAMPLGMRPQKALNTNYYKGIASNKEETG